MLIDQASVSISLVQKRHPSPRLQYKHDSWCHLGIALEICGTVKLSGKSGCLRGLLVASGELVSPSNKRQPARAVTIQAVVLNQTPSLLACTRERRRQLEVQQQPSQGQGGQL